MSDKKTIITKDGDRVSVAADTDETTIEILKNAEPLRFWEDVYEGNSPNGQDYGAYDELEKWLKNAGLELKENDGYGDLEMILYYLSRETGFSTISHRGKTIKFHVQSRKGTSHREFGYTWRAEYRLVEV